MCQGWGKFWELFSLWGQMNNLWVLGVGGDCEKLLLCILIDVLVESVPAKNAEILGYTFMT